MFWINFLEPNKWMLVDDICDFALLVSSESNLFKKVRVKFERPLYLLSLQYCKSVFTIFNKVLKTNGNDIKVFNM